MTRMIRTAARALHEALLPALLFSVALTVPPPAAAQTTPPPVLVQTQQLTPTDAEIYPTPGSAARQVGFGAAIAFQRDTALISMPLYQPNAGRVAIFKRDAAGQWQRDGSIDPASTPGVYGYAYAFGLGIALRDDYALILSTTANYLYHKVHDQWTQLDLVPGVCCFEPNGETIDPPFIFVTNKVYRIGPQGKLQLTQTLVGDDPTFADAFGNEVSESDGTLVISATNDNQERGALYTFEQHDGLWVKRQKIVANDGQVGDDLGTDVVISGDIMVAAAAGKDYNYVNPACNNQPTSGVLYVFARVHGVWIQQQEIVNPCIYGFQFFALDHDWLSVSFPTFAFGTQTSGSLVYRREDQPRSSSVNFVPYGTVTLPGAGYQTQTVVHGSTLFSQDGGDYQFPAGLVDVYQLPKDEHRDDQ